jgi:glycosyltransferase involved in cell wall biosynthesis
MAKITYLLESTELWGGTKVVFEQAELLSENGYDVTILAKGADPDWYDLKAPLTTVERFDSEVIPESDIVIGTFWSTVEEACRAQKGVAVHLCQGYEGSFKEYGPLKDQIDEVYSLRIPKLTVSRHVDALLRERFNAETFYIGQMVDRSIFYPAKAREESLNHFRALVVGPFEADVKNIRTALKGLSVAKNIMHLPLDLIRVSQLPSTDEERQIMKPEGYHYHVPYHAMGNFYRSADVFVSLSREEEGW